MIQRSDYVRWVGLKILLWSAAFGAAAAALPGPGDAPIAEVSWYGMKLAHLIIGTAAAGASLFFLPQFTGIALGRTVVCGMFCATVGTPLLAALLSALSVKYLGSPVPGAEPVLAAALGVGGVYIIPMGQRGWEALRNDPWGSLGRVIDRIRGRGRNEP